MRETRSGPRSGKPLSQYIWTLRKGVADKCYEGTINEMLIAAFAAPARPCDLIPQITADYVKRFKPPESSVSPRNYVSQRLYELKRRGLFIIRGVK